MFVVMQLNKDVDVSVMGLEVNLSLSYADGMVGAIPVFESEEAAEIFAGEKYKVAEIIVEET